MLQSNPSQADSTRLAYRDFGMLHSPEDNSFEDTLNLVKGLVRRQYPLIIFTTVFSLIAGALYLVVTPPTYTAHVQLLLGNPNTPLVQQPSLGLGTESPIDPALIDTQLQVLRSRAIISSVIQQLKLEDDSELRRPGPPLLKRMRVLLGEASDSAPTDENQNQPSEEMIEAFQERLLATRVNVSNVIDISFSWSNAVRAAEIANAIANAYITDQLNAKFEANKTALLWLQQRLEALGKQADDAERAVNAYKSQNNLVTSTDGKPIDEQQIAELNSRLAAARALAAEASVRLNRYESILKENPEISESIGTLDAGGSDVLASPIITALRQQYLEAQRRENEYAAKFGKDHLAVINLRNRMRDIRSSIFEEVRRLTETARSDQVNATQRKDEVEKQLAQAVALSRSTNAAEVTLRELLTKAKGYRNLYETFLQRYMGSTQQQTFPISEARVIYAASPPLKKSKPKTLIVFALSLFGGIGFGSGLAFLRDLVDRVFRTPTQLEDTLGLPCFSVVPQLQPNKLENYQSSVPIQGGQEQGLKTLARASSPHWAVVNMPLSRFAESIRSIKLGIDLSRDHASNKVIGITSTLPHEGKSTIAACLGQLIGQGGKRAIIVDCDLRNPSLSKALAPNAKIGLLEVLFGTQPLEQALWTDTKTNLVFLPMVKNRTLLHSSEMLTTEPMRILVERLRSMYDYVIVDLPPLTPIVDARASSTLVDCFVYVVEWGRTKIDVVKHALHTAPNVYENVIGTVLNKTDIKGMASYDGSRSDYYSESHYGHYGLSDTES
jgi:polysaccharide biosynthesis transport protein